VTQLGIDSVFIVEGKRTPFGAFGGSLKDVSPVDLANYASKNLIDSLGINPEDLAIGVVQMQPGAETLKSRIWGGASKVELGFMGSGKGSQQGLTPGSFSREDREAIRDLARVNKVETQTHATVSISGLSGFNQGEFNENMRKQTLDEINRAIDFSAEATSGGGVVVHTGEFPRPLTKIEGQTKDGKPLFSGHLKESEQAAEYLVDSHTGRLISAVREDEVIWVPQYEYEKDANGNIKYQNGRPLKKYMVDENGTKIKDEFVVDYINEYKDDPEYGEYVKSLDPYIPEYHKDEKGNIKTTPMRYDKFREDFMKSKENLSKQEMEKRAALEFFRMQNEGEIQRALGSAREFEQLYHDGIDNRDKILTAIETYKQIMDAAKKKGEEWRHTVRTNPIARSSEMLNMIPPNEQDPVSYLQDQLHELDRRIAYGREASVGGRLQARKIQDQIRHAKPVEDFALSKTAESISEAAIYAMRRQEQENRKRKELGIEELKPIFVSPENVFSEQFGSNPAELAKIINKSREKMVQDLWDEESKQAKVAGVKSLDQAKTLAEEHIKGTLDVGHLNMWRKSWNEDLKKSPEENDKAFKTWAVGELKKLTDKGLLGNVHMHDNFGFHDEHVEIGRGTAPIDEVVDLLKKAGMSDKITIEINSQNLNTALPHAMSQFGNPIYAAGTRLPTGTPNQFTQIRGAYMGQAQSPFYIVGAYSPSEDWRLWTETPLE